MKKLFWSREAIHLKRSFAFIAIIIILFWFVGCGEEDPPSGNGNGNGIDVIETGISGTDYLNIEHGFRLSNLPASDWVIKTRSGKDLETNTEVVLLMAFTTEDKFTFDTGQLMSEQIPFTEISVYGPDSSLPSSPDVAKEVMNARIAVWEQLGVIVISKKPLAVVNTTGYEATLFMALEDYNLIIKQAYFAKNDKGYTVALITPEDQFTSTLAYIDPIIASFELLGL